jgi:Protein of unknown function (DUF1615)
MGSRHRLWLICVAAVAASCAEQPPATSPAKMAPSEERAAIDRALPRYVADRNGWVTDIYAAFRALEITATRENACAVIAVTEQESGFHVDPVIPNLGTIAWREIDKRAEHADIPVSLVHEVLRLNSSTGQTYADRIDRAMTEKQLSDIFEDFTGSIPLGRSLFASWNPIRTRGPMQVNVAFAEQFSAAHPYPYPVKVSIADEVFTRRGSVYFGTAHLLAYAPPYEGYLYRFADFNAGQYASRNAAFQVALGRAAGVPLAADGALIAHDTGGKPGSTELAARSIAQQLGLSDSDIHAALEQGKSHDFERTRLYEGVYRLAERRAGRALPRAALPSIKLEGPKISRNLTTEWYAHRVDGRFKQCLAR